MMALLLPAGLALLGGSAAAPSRATAAAGGAPAVYPAVGDEPSCSKALNCSGGGSLLTGDCVVTAPVQMICCPNGIISFQGNLTIVDGGGIYVTDRPNQPVPTCWDPKSSMLKLSGNGTLIMGGTASIDATMVHIDVTVSLFHAPLFF
jgi:predicted outer membrane repeat protein